MTRGARAPRPERGPTAPRGGGVSRVPGAAGRISQLGARIGRPLGPLAAAALLLSACATEHGPTIEETRARAEAGDADAQVALAVDYDAGKGVQLNYAEAVRWYERAAAAGDKVAQCDLGTHYLGGLGVPRDDVKSIELFRKSAAQGLPQAEYSLGMMCELGLGAAQDRTAAIQWYMKAAEHGVPEAMLNLGLDCHDGTGVPRNRVEAYKWVDLARLFAQDGGSSGTKSRIAAALSKLKAELSKDEIEEARELSYEWYERYEEDN